jgi:uncharacterized protein (TIGR00730 family)
MHITVFSSSSTSVDRKYFDAAHALGQAVAQRGWTVVYGGNDVGPMGAVAHGARAASGRVVGITPQYFVDIGCADRACDELIVVESMRQRKQILEQRADAFVALPGGIGTVEELVEIWVGRQLKMHTKPIVLLNLDGFWEPLLELFREGIDSNFYRPNTFEMVRVVSTVDEAMLALESALSPAEA